MSVTNVSGTPLECCFNIKLIHVDGYCLLVTTSKAMTTTGYLKRNTAVDDLHHEKCPHQIYCGVLENLSFEKNDVRSSALWVCVWAQGAQGLPEGPSSPPLFHRRQPLTEKKHVWKESHELLHLTWLDL